MARLPYLTRPDLPERDRDLLDRDINLHRLLAHSPAGARAFSHLSNWIRYQSALDARLRELVILQIGYCSQSAYEFSHHIKICLLYTSPSPRDATLSRMPSSA